jgi:hypothetical protein
MLDVGCFPQVQEGILPMNRPTPEPAAGVPPVIPPKPDRWRQLWSIGAVLLIAALVILFAFNPSSHSFYPVCVFHRVTGWECPGCGGLRSVHHLLRGEVLTAFQFNPVVVIALPVLAWIGWRRWRRGSQPGRMSLTQQAVLGWTILGVLIVFWLLRNLPVEFLRMPLE